jgi:hypothetical protein
MLKPLLLATSLLAFAPALHASAQTYDIKRVGAWSAFTGRASDGMPICGMSTSWNNGQFFSIKRFGSQQYLVLQAINPAWAFNGSDVTVRMTMDEHDAWTASAATESGGTKLEFTVPLASVKQFLQEVYASDQMELDMGANHITWDIDLHGTADIATAFGDCLDAME